jgi:hypothetical protein
MYVKQNVDGFKHIFRHREIALISLYSLSISYVFLTGLWWLYQKSANEVNLAPQFVGILIGALYAMRSFGTVLIQKIQHKGQDQKLIWLAVLQGLFSLIVAIPGQLVGIFGLAGRYLTDGIRQPLLSAAQNKHIESKYRATALSAVSLLTSLVLALTNPLIGKGIDLYGARVMVGILSIVSFGVGLPLAIIMRTKESK